MLLAVKADEHIRIRHDDEQCGFAIHVGENTVHIRAKSKYEPGADRTTLVIESRVEVVK
jgi:hypothetical protein